MTIKSLDSLGSHICHYCWHDKKAVNTCEKSDCLPRLVNQVNEQILQMEYLYSLINRTSIDKDSLLIIDEWFNPKGELL